MICVSLAEKTLDDYLGVLPNVDFAEIRLDAVDLSIAQTAELFASHPRLIATCRPGRHPDDRRKELLIAAIDAGAAYVDIELESEASYREEIVAVARSRECVTIVSYHNYEKTPDRPSLATVISECFRLGADIAKIACTAQTEKDSARLLGLLEDDRKIVVVAMGQAGRIVRIAAPLLGSPFTFASLAPGKETAEGQIERQTLASLIATIEGGLPMEAAR